MSTEKAFLDELSVVVVTWNGDELLENCLKSLRTACGLAPEIVVVDNANLQSTRDVVACFENAKYVAAKENLGFAGGNNLGLSFCTRKYVLLLNNDTIVHEEPFSQMVRYLEDNPQVAVVQGKMRLVRQGDVLDECGSYLTNWGDLYSRYLYAPVESRVNSGAVYHAKGACLMFRRAILADLNGILFHDHFKSYYEDVDFCHRVWLAGYEVHFLDTPPIDHLGGGTSSKLPKESVGKRWVANRLFSFYTTFGALGLWTVFFRYLLIECVVVLRFLVGWNGREVRIRVGGALLFLREFKKARQMRAEIQRNRKVGDRRLFAKIVARLPFSYQVNQLRGKNKVFADADRKSCEKMGSACRPKILFITPYVPGSDTHSGGHVRNEFLFQALKQVGDVYTTVFGWWYEPDGTISPTDPRMRHVSRFDARHRWTGSIAVVALFARLFRRFNWAFMGRQEVLKRLGWEGERFDFVVTRFAWTAARTAAWKIAPLVVDIDDLPSEDFNTLVRPKLGYLAGAVGLWLTRSWYGALLRLARCAWIANREQVEKVTPYCPCLFLPNVASMPVGEPSKHPTPRFSIMTVASLDYSANTEGIDWFLRTVWPVVYQRYQGLEFAIAGRGLSDELQKRWGAIAGVKLLGFVKDLDALYMESLAVVAPVFSGGGTAVKVIEALARGCKVFATPFALRGLSSAQKRKAEVSEFVDAEGFVREFMRYIEASEDVRWEMAEHMRAMIREDFSMEVFQDAVRKAFDDGVES